MLFCMERLIRRWIRRKMNRKSVWRSMPKARGILRRLVLKSVPSLSTSARITSFPGGEDAYEVDDAKGPCNVYGKSKLMGEQAVQELLQKYFIVRISWVFGINGKNFIRTMLNLAKTHKELTVVGDQIGSPTYTRDLAVLLADMAVTEKYGVYHATNEGFCSWAEFAAEVFRQAGREVTVTPVDSAAYPTKAVRPHNSRMSKQALVQAGFKQLPRWQDAVGRYLIELQSEATLTA